MNRHYHDSTTKQTWLIRLGMAAVICGALMVLPRLVSDQASGRKLSVLKNKLSEVRQENAKVDQENQDLLRQISAARRDPLVVQELARTELGLVFPGERVIVVQPAIEIDAKAGKP